MFSLFAIGIYLAGLGLPVYLLIHFHSQAWYWHALAATAALAMGVVPMPDWLASAGPSADLATGFAFIVLMVWGAGGLLMFQSHHEKHAF